MPFVESPCRLRVVLEDMLLDVGRLVGLTRVVKCNALLNASVYGRVQWIRQRLELGEELAVGGLLTIKRPERPGNPSRRVDLAFGGVKRHASGRIQRHVRGH